MQKIISCFSAFILLLFITSCSSPGGLFGKKTPHEQYEKKIKQSGMGENPLGEAWLKQAAITLSNPVDITIPYIETGYFPDERANGIGLRFRAKRGQKISIRLSKKAAPGFTMYLDLWQPYPIQENRTPKFLSAADTASLVIDHVVNEDTAFIVRLQPELMKEGEYTLSISAGPSLLFPISSKVKSSIGSFWGAGRDNGERKHEGIDIFAPKYSPAVAAATGLITRVNENALGGKVVFLHPDNTFYSLYYAHLDSQIAKEGQRVNAGDVIGLTGNTGNAKNTASHLHFGIYTNSGAIDPLYFVKNDYKEAMKVSVPVANINNWVRAVKNARIIVHGSPFPLEENTLLRTDAGTAGQYRVTLPDGRKGFIASTMVIPVTKPIKRLSVKRSLALLSAPDREGLTKKMLTAGDKINVLAIFNDYYFVDKDNLQGWVAKVDL